MTTYKLSYFKDTGKWYADSSIGLDENIPWHEAIEYITRIAKARALPRLVENHSPYHVLVYGENMVQHLILIKDTN